MNILALDVTTDSGGLALLRDGSLHRQYRFPPGAGYGETLFGQLQEFLESAGVTLGEIDVFASASGPGTFTGIRIGLAAVKALAEATGKGALGVSNLRALAFYGTAPERTAVLDARRGEFYWGTYTDRLQLVGSEQVGPHPEVSQQLVTQKEGLLASNRPVVMAPAHLAVAVAGCASQDLQAGCSTDPLLLDANYVRRSDGAQAWLDRPGGLERL